MFKKKSRQMVAEGHLVIEEILKVHKRIDQALVSIDIHHGERQSDYSAWSEIYAECIVDLRNLKLRVARFEDHDITGTRIVLLDTLEAVMDHVRDCHESKHVPEIESVNEYRSYVYECCLRILEREQHNLE